MTEVLSSTPSRNRNLTAIVVMAAGLIAFLYGLGRGMAIDPRVDMHGRMVAYAIGTGGLAAAFAAHLALSKPGAGRRFSALLAAASFALFILQLTKTF